MTSLLVKLTRFHSLTHQSDQSIYCLFEDMNFSDESKINIKMDSSIKWVYIGCTYMRDHSDGKIYPPSHRDLRVKVSSSREAVCAVGC